MQGEERGVGDGRCSGWKKYLEQRPCQGDFQLRNNLKGDLGLHLNVMTLRAEHRVTNKTEGHRDKDEKEVRKTRR